eukprot:747824-Hanusia_phi.AAC.3
MPSGSTQNQGLSKSSRGRSQTRCPADASVSLLRADESRRYDYLMEHPTQSSLRLTMVRSVTGDQMGGALKEAVQPRLKRFTSDEVRAAAEGGGLLTGMKGAIARDMSEFEKQFDMSSLAAGTILTFTRLKASGARELSGWRVTFRQSGSLVSEIDGKDKGEIASEALSKSLFSVFLDEDSVVDRSKLLQRLAVL